MLSDQKNETAAFHTKGLLGILAFCAFLVGLDSLLVSPLIPAMTSTTHTPAHQGGLLVTAYAMLYGLSAPLFGPVSDRWGRKKLIVLGIAVFGIATAVTGFAATFAELLLFRAIAGLGGAMIMPTVFAMIGDFFPYPMRGKAIGIVTGAMMGSTVLGVPVGSFFAYAGSWQGTFWAVGVLTFAAFLLVLMKVPAMPPKRDIPVSPLTAYRRQFKTAFTNPSVLFVLLSTLLWMAGIQGMFAYVGVYYNENFNLNEAQIGFVMLAAGFGNVLGNILGGRLSDKVGKKKVIIIASSAAAVGVVSFSLLDQFMAAAIIAQVVWSSAVGFGQSPLTALASELSPEVRGTVLALNSSAMYIGMMAATAVSAAMLTAGGFVTVGVLCGAASLLVSPIIGFLVKDLHSTKKREIPG